MQTNNSKSLVLGIVTGVSFAAIAGVMMGQGASQPIKSETQYFVSGESDEAHLWVREGTNLRCVGHGSCAAHQHDHKEGDGHDHKEGDGHDHGKDAPTKK